MTDFMRGKGARALPTLALAAAIMLAGSACDTNKLVAIVDPSTRLPGDVDNVGSLPALANGAFRQFVGGYSGFGGDAFLSSSAVISDETYYGDTFTTRLAADRRTLQAAVLGNISDAAFSRLQQARLDARRAYASYNQFTTPATASADSLAKGQLRTIEGYTYVTLSEGWCGDVPFSTVPETGPIDPADIVGGVGISTSQMNDSAVTRFNQALVDDRTNQLAMLGKARALLNNGQFTAAAAAVASIPTNYVFLIQHSTNVSSENNPMTSLMQNGRYGVANLEGAQTSTGAAARSDVGTTATTGISAEGLPFRGLRDVRVPYELKPTNGLCFSQSLNCYLNDNYPTLDADVPLASGVEARLIEAEAALQNGTPAVMMQKLNDLRASSTALAAGLYPSRKLTEGVFKTNNVPNTLAPLADPADPLTTPAVQFEARRALLFRERALWLYNTGHRQGDLRRLARAPYNFATSAVFPSGPFFRGGTYGADVAFPVPFAEQNNTNFVPANCDTTKP